MTPKTLLSCYLSRFFTLTSKPIRSRIRKMTSIRAGHRKQKLIIAPEGYQLQNYALSE